MTRVTNAPEAPLPSPDLVAELARIPAFEAIAPEALELLARRGVTRRAHRGATLWIQGATPRGLHVLLEGRVRAVRAHDGREAVLHRSGPGTTLGEIPLFDGG
ncbi:MAG TPA: cyclic nucleotide-binding domain-containing protein, partial [Longimicrobiales bacterium]|nr:cyclic nucleotide-binding domain-containing protein [Longimicrobiales bacterium]